jgi:hypothetical protein
MPVKRRKSKRREPTPAWIFDYFETGVCLAEDKFAVFDLNPKYWGEISVELLESYLRAHPGMRPWKWWVEEAPAPELVEQGKGLEPVKVMRRQVGGSGSLTGNPELHFGVPGWVNGFDPPLPDDPPLFESQGAFLRRHDLLSPIEKRRLRKKDFGPESIALGYDKPIEPLDKFLRRHNRKFATPAGNGNNSESATK